MLHIYNTLHKRIEEITTLKPGVARMYTCGPTVYRHAHIGNLRSYLMADWIKRALVHHAIDVVHIKNITDVGHMRQEQLERGGDKVILAALAEGKTPQEIADFYTATFHKDESKLNILPANRFPRATEHINDMLDVILRLLNNGSAYVSGENIYFDVEKYSPYGQLSGNIGGDLIEGVRVEADPLKRDPRDFVLWKSAEYGRNLKWNSPWGEGFPGWHIECSAMSTRYLGEEQDIHTGGVDNIFPHHEGEIAQSEAAFGKQYVRYWIHGQHLLADGVKMAKSAGNEFLLTDLEDRGLEPLAFRYLCLTVKYRHRLNFTFNSLKSAQRGLTHLRDRVWGWQRSMPQYDVRDNQNTGLNLEEWRARFWSAVDDDLNLPQALSILWKVAHSTIPDEAKLILVTEFDNLLGLDLTSNDRLATLPQPEAARLADREGHRTNLKYDLSDEVRVDLQRQGYLIQDTKDGPAIRPKTAFELHEERWPSISTSKEIHSFINDDSTVQYTIIVAATNYLEDVKRCVNSVLLWSNDVTMELIVIDNGCTDGTAEWLQTLQLSNPLVRVIHCDHQLGDAQAKNIGLTQSRGDILVLLDPSVEITGAFLTRINQLLRDETIGVVGSWGILSEDLHHFHKEIMSGEADAMQGYCFAFRRELLRTVGLMRECFRFYRNLDLDFSFQFRDQGLRIMADNKLHMLRHEHKQWSELGEDERDQLSRRNFKHFFKKWGDRKDLLVTNTCP